MPLSQFERSVLLLHLHVEMLPGEAAVTNLITMEGAMRLIMDA